MPFNKPILPAIISTAFVLRGDYCMKPNAVRPFGGSVINIDHQLLKNKWYYVLYSTIIFISLYCKVESDSKTNKRIPDTCRLKLHLGYPTK